MITFWIYWYFNFWAFNILAYSIEFRSYFSFLLLPNTFPQKHFYVLSQRKLKPIDFPIKTKEISQKPVRIWQLLLNNPNFVSIKEKLHQTYRTREFITYKT